MVKPHPTPSRWRRLRPWAIVGLALFTIVAAASGALFGLATWTQANDNHTEGYDNHQLLLTVEADANGITKAGGSIASADKSILSLVKQDHEENVEILAWVQAICSANPSCVPPIFTSVP